MTGALRERFRRAAAELVAPGAAVAEETAKFDRTAFRRLGEQGLLRALAPRAWGGEGLGLRGAAAAIDGLASASDDVGFAVSVMAHWVATQLLIEHGSAEQLERWLPRLLSGHWLAGVANAEPRAGTDVMGLRSRATQNGAGFVLSGRKRSITNVGEADLLLVSARLRGQSEREAIQAFVLELPVTGAHARPIHDLAGLRSSATGDLLLRNVQLPQVALLGQRGGGVELFRSTFSWERLLSGYLFLAIIRRAQSRALEHAEERTQFGQAIGRNQHVQERIVRMHVAAELLDAHLAATLEAACAGQDVFGALSLIKIHGVEAALDAAQGLVRILGGRGVRRRALAEKLLRDALTLSVFGGTVELHKTIAYSELVRRRAAAAMVPELEVVDRAALSPELTAELVALTAAAFPRRSELAGRYYFDAPPDELVLARRAGKLVGFRTLVYRELQVADQQVLAAGIGIAVVPAEQRTSVGTALTQAALERLRARGVSLVLAFLFTPAAEPLLRRFGFRELRSHVSYFARESGEQQSETMSCYALELSGTALLAAIEAHGRLHLGVGTF